jgi:murein L,D-transpeptidase YcbB/YkuD
VQSIAAMQEKSPYTSGPSQVLRIIGKRFESVAQLGERLAPQHLEYAALRNALQRYHTLATEHELTALPHDLKISPGERHPQVPVLRRNLILLGDLGDSGENDPCDEQLLEAVRRFQMRHGLEADGLLGPGAIEAMNIPIEARIRQIEVNLDRWRWLPNDGVYASSLPSSSQHMHYEISASGYDLPRRIHHTPDLT